VDGTVHFEHETRTKKRVRVAGLAGE